MQLRTFTSVTVMMKAQNIFLFSAEIRSAFQFQRNQGIDPSMAEKAVNTKPKERIPLSTETFFPAGDFSSRNPADACSTYVEVEKKQSDEQKSLTKRQRRRRTVERNEYASASSPNQRSGESLSNSEDHVTGSQIKSAGNVLSSGFSTPNTYDFDSGFSDAQQQMSRRRRRESSSTPRRQRALGVWSPTVTDDSVHMGSDNCGREAGTTCSAVPEAERNSFQQMKPRCVNGRRSRASRNRSLRSAVEISTATSPEETTFHLGDRSCYGKSKSISWHSVVIF